MTRTILSGFAALATLWFALEPTSLQSAEQAAAVAQAPSSEEISLLDEVAAWSGEAPLADPAGLVDERVPMEVVARPFPQDSTLAVAVLERHDSFEHFVSLSAGSPGLLRGVPFAELIGPTARRHGVDPLLVAAVIEAESSFDPHAVSPVGAIGLMQVMPVTAGDLGSTDPLDLSRPSKNVDIGTRYLARLLKRFDGNVALAVAAYNAGPGAVARFDGLPPYAETQKYVERVLTRYVASLRAALPPGEGRRLAQQSLDRG